jgi:flagellar biosynthesis protein FliQ
MADANATSVSQVLSYISGEVPMFIPAILFGFFMILFLGSYFAQQRTRGFADIFTSLAVSSYITAIASVILSFIPNVINVYVVVVCIAIAVISTAILLGQGNEE